MTPTPITTFEQFLEAIPKDGWELNKYHLVRRDRQCPITSLEKRPAYCFNKVGRLYGMSPDLISRIVNAADLQDVQSHPTHASDRKALLSVLGLQEADPQTTKEPP